MHTIVMCKTDDSANINHDYTHYFVKKKKIIIIIINK